MAAAFVPNQMFDAAITEEAPGHIFSAGTEPWLVQSGPLDCLRFVSCQQVKQTDVLPGIYFTR